MNNNLDEMVNNIVNLNSDENLTDEQIREKNKKYVEQVYNEVEKVGIVPSLAAVQELELTLKQKAAQMRDAKGTKQEDNYPKKLADPYNLTNPLIEVVSTDKLNFDKQYDPQDFFIKQALDGKAIKEVQQKIAEIYDAPHNVVDGKKVYKTYYFNVEAWCLELFFEAVGWDAKIVEAVMNGKNKVLQSDIAKLGFAQLAIAARGKK